MLHQDESHAGFARHRRQKFGVGLEPAGRRADADNRKTVFFGVLPSGIFDGGVSCWLAGRARWQGWTVSVSREMPSLAHRSSFSEYREDQRIEQ
jgi:hypothetical protein